MLIAKNAAVSEPLRFTDGYISLPSSSRLTSHLYGYLGVARVATFNVMIESHRRAQIINIWDTSLEKEEKKTEKEQSIWQVEDGYYPRNQHVRTTHTHRCSSPLYLQFTTT